MFRLAPAVIGLVVLVVAFAISSGILTVLGGALVAVAVLWFLATGTTTRTGRESDTEMRHGG